jgi:hypothetical protein
MTDTKRTNEDAGRTMALHPFEECLEHHLFERERHCRCGEVLAHPNHGEVKEVA